MDLDEFTKGTIFALRQYAKWTIRKIAITSKKNFNTVHRYCNQISKQTSDVKSKRANCGRHKKVSLSQEQQIIENFAFSKLI